MTTRILEEVCTLDEFWGLFLLSCPPPPGMPPEVVASYRWFYAAGLGCATVLLKRLETEHPERRAAILAQVEKQCIEATGVKLDA
jgi:hypothetical protein